MTPRPKQPYDMNLIGIISHHGTKDNGHYIAITRRDDKWTLYNDAIATQTTMSHIHQTQAYILMYRKAEPRPETREPVPKDIYQKNMRVDYGLKETSTLDLERNRTERSQPHSRIS